MITSSRARVGVLTLVATAALASVTMTPVATAHAAAAPAYSVVNVGKQYGGEPYILSDPSGNLFDSSPSLGATFLLSTDHGSTWTGPVGPDPASGDTGLGSDQSGAIYLTNLAGSVDGPAPLQAGVFKTTDKGKTFTQSQPANLPAKTCGASCNPFGVDRQWVDGYIPPGKTTDTGEVVLMYHDFYGLSRIWVNISQDGGKTFGQPVDVESSFAPAAAAQAAIVNADSLCDTVPVGMFIAKGGPHPGRIFTAWIAADPSAPVTGCNLSQAQSFHNLIVAWSDDQGATWTPQVAFDGGLFHDASSPFSGFALDNQGNPYFGFTMNLNSDPVTCAGTDTPPAPACEFDMYVVYSPDGGSTWKGGTGTASATAPPGSAAAPIKVNTDQGTHFFPWIAAQDPGHVVVSYLHTPALIATDPNGKEHPGSCITPGCTFPGVWNVFASQSANLTAAAPVFTTTQLTTTGMHTGDICNLGIACVPGVSNRNLLDFQTVTIDPLGCAHIAYSDDMSTPNNLKAANQTAGCFAVASVQVPETPWAVLLIPAGLAAVWYLGRRRGTRERPAPA